MAVPGPGVGEQPQFPEVHADGPLQFGQFGVGAGDVFAGGGDGVGQFLADRAGPADPQFPQPVLGGGGDRVGQGGGPARRFGGDGQVDHLGGAELDPAGGPDEHVRPLGLDEVGAGIVRRPVEDPPGQPVPPRRRGRRTDRLERRGDDGGMPGDFLDGLLGGADLVGVFVAPLADVLPDRLVAKDQRLGGRPTALVDQHRIADPQHAADDRQRPDQADVPPQRRPKVAEPERLVGRGRSSAAARRQVGNGRFVNATSRPTPVPETVRSARSPPLGVKAFRISLSPEGTRRADGAFRGGPKLVTTSTPRAALRETAETASRGPASPFARPARIGTAPARRKRGTECRGYVVGSMRSNCSGRALRRCRRYRLVVNPSAPTAAPRRYLRSRRSRPGTPPPRPGPAPPLAPGPPPRRRSPRSRTPARRSSRPRGPGRRR